jgi:hypothetical protein
VESQEAVNKDTAHEVVAGRLLDVAGETTGVALVRATQAASNAALRACAIGAASVGNFRSEKGPTTSCAEASSCELREGDAG